MKKRCGWIKSVRKSKDLTFLAVTDGRSDFQITVKSDVIVVGEIKVGCSFEALGEDSTTPRGSYEFLCQSLIILGSSDDTYPIQPKRHTFDYLRTIPEHRGRTKGFQSVWMMRHLLSKSLQDRLSDLEFCQYFTPVITFADCEGAGQTFDVSSDWMQQKLTVSGQLHLEVGAMSLGQVYTFGPCFRAEKSSTKKHLSEFWMLECEMVHYDLETTMKFTEDLIKHTLCQIVLRKELFDRMEIDASHVEELLKRDWPVIEYSAVCDRYGLIFGEDIGSEIEAKLVEDLSGPVFVCRYAKELKPFYMLKGDRTAECFDLIFPHVGELVGGSVREWFYDKLKAEMIESRLDLEKMDWYLQTRKYGSVSHSGFGLGFDRLLMFVCKLQKIHDAMPFPMSF